MGWTPGGWFFCEPRKMECVLSAFPAARDWQRKGSYLTAWSVPPSTFFVAFLILVRAGHSYRVAHWGGAVLATALQTVEGYRTPDEALVC